MIISTAYYLVSKLNWRFRLFVPNEHQQLVNPTACSIEVVVGSPTSCECLQTLWFINLDHKYISIYISSTPTSEKCL